MSFFDALIFGLTLSGCATQSGWAPTIDTYGDKNTANLQQDKIECDELAKDSSNHTSEEVGKGALIGGALGAAAGATPPAGAAAGAAGAAPPPPSKLARSGMA